MERRQPTGRDPGVVVEERDRVAARLLDQPAVAAGEAQVAVALDQARARPARPQPVGGAVARAVVEDEELPVDAGRLERLDRRTQRLEVRETVPAQDGDRDAPRLSQLVLPAR
jgi:hypothetical protein